MKKILIKLLLFLLPILFTINIKAQLDSTNYYHTSKTYRYPKYEDKDLIKAKTELFLVDLKKQGFKIVKNKIEEYKIDIDLSLQLESKNIISFNVEYSFDDSSYSVDLWFPKIYDARKKTWTYLQKDKHEDLGLLKTTEDLVFQSYENEINSNF